MPSAEKTALPISGDPLDHQAFVASVKGDRLEALKDLVRRSRGIQFGLALLGAAGLFFVSAFLTYTVLGAVLR